MELSSDFLPKAKKISNKEEADNFEQELMKLGQENLKKVGYFANNFKNYHSKKFVDEIKAVEPEERTFILNMLEVMFYLSQFSGRGSMEASDLEDINSVRANKPSPTRFEEAALFLAKAKNLKEKNQAKELSESLNESLDEQDMKKIMHFFRDFGTYNCRAFITEVSSLDSAEKSFIFDLLEGFYYINEINGYNREGPSPIPLFNRLRVSQEGVEKEKLFQAKDLLARSKKAKTEEITSLYYEIIQDEDFQKVEEIMSRLNQGSFDEEINFLKAPANAWTLYMLESYLYTLKDSGQIQEHFFDKILPVLNEIHSHEGIISLEKAKVFRDRAKDLDSKEGVLKLKSDLSNDDSNGKMQDLVKKFSCFVDEFKNLGIEEKSASILMAEALKYVEKGMKNEKEENLLTNMLSLMKNIGNDK